MLILAPLLFGAGESKNSSQKQDFSSYVDPFIGVLDNESNCVIGPQLPFGSINPSPQTPLGEHDGYSPLQPIRGFGQLHVSGTGWGKYGQIFVSPQLGLAVGEKDHDSPKANETAKAFEYQVLLTRYNIGVVCTPSRHSAIYRFTYPKSDSSNLLIDITHNIPMDIATEIGGTVFAGDVEIDTSEGYIIKGKGTYFGGFGDGKYEVFFCAAVDKRPKSYGTWMNGLVGSRNRIQNIVKPNDRVGAYLSFSTNEGETVQMKIAVSFKSVVQALHWLHTEIPGWDYASMKNSAIDVWNEQLAKIAVEGGSDSLRTIFYTALYHSMLMPRDRTGDMIGFPDGAALWDDEYAVWDTWRTMFPLMAMINPEMVEGNVNSFIERYALNGKVKDSFIAGKDMNNEQGGNDVDNIITDAYVRGIKGVDWEEAYRIVKHDAETQRKGWEGWEGNKSDSISGSYRRNGWIAADTMSCSQTVEYAYNDFCAATLARGLGKTEDAAKYLKRSGQWQALWNAKAMSDGFSGFVVPRRSDGTWVDIDAKKNWESWKNYFYEGSSWTYSYFVPHQFPTLVDLCGGKEEYALRLEHALKNDLIEYFNEPSFLAIPSFNYAGRPDLAEYWMHKLMHDGYTVKGYPGNDDSGAMSSWFVFAAIGLFPNAGQDLYYVQGPSFSKVSINLGGGKSIVIIGENASENNIYVQSLTVNGKKWNTPFISHSALKEGAVLDFVMGDTPSSWGR